MSQTFRQIILEMRFAFSNFYWLFLPFSRKKRFTYALHLAKIVEPFARKMSRPAMPISALGTYREYLTGAMLNSITIHGIEFDSVVTVEGADLITPGGAIFIGGHFHLNFIFLRWLYDVGRQPAVFILVSADEWRILGTKVPLEVLNRRAMSLNRVRHLTANGKTVAAVIDTTSADYNWKRLNIPNHDIFVTDALIKLAERTKTPIFFFDTYFDRDDNVVLKIVPAASTVADVVLEEYARFIESALEKRKNPPESA